MELIINHSHLKTHPDRVTFLQEKIAEYCDRYLKQITIIYKNLNQRQKKIIKDDYNSNALDFINKNPNKINPKELLAICATNFKRKIAEIVLERFKNNLDNLTFNEIQQYFSQNETDPRLLEENEKEKSLHESFLIIKSYVETGEQKILKKNQNNEIKKLENEMQQIKTQIDKFNKMIFETEKSVEAAKKIRNFFYFLILIAIAFLICFSAEEINFDAKEGTSAFFALLFFIVSYSKNKKIEMDEIVIDYQKNRKKSFVQKKSEIKNEKSKLESQNE